MSRSDKNSTWYTPAERLPTFADGPRRFMNKVEVEVECKLGVERRNFFVGGGFDDNDILGKGVIRWRPVAVNMLFGADLKAFLADDSVWPTGTYMDDVLVSVNGKKYGDGVDLDKLQIRPDAIVEIECGDVMQAGNRLCSLWEHFESWVRTSEQEQITVTAPPKLMAAIRAAVEAAGGTILK